MLYTSHLCPPLPVSSGIIAAQNMCRRANTHIFRMLAGRLSTHNRGDQREPTQSLTRMLSVSYRTKLLEQELSGSPKGSSLDRNSRQAEIKRHVVLGAKAKDGCSADMIVKYTLKRTMERPVRQGHLIPFPSLGAEDGLKVSLREKESKLRPSASLSKSELCFHP